MTKPGAQPDAVGFVLAGGQSSRMGREKALLPWQGRTLVENALAILREAGLPAAIAGARASGLAAFAPVVPDAEPGLGPLAGLCAALASAPAHWAVFLPVDVPLLPAALLLYMLHHARITQRPITLASVAGYAQTFPAVVARAALPTLRQALHSGNGGCFAAFRAAAAAAGQPLTVLPAEVLAQSGHGSHPAGLPPVRWFLNVNTPDDLRLAAMQRAAHLA